MIYSSYQNAIFDAVTGGTEHLIVNALAGSGKSTTAVEIAKRLPSNNNLFCAFNSKIAESLRGKLPSNVACKTLNAYGWGICLKNFRGVRLNQFKTDDLIKDIVPREEQRFVGGFIRQMVGLLKANCVYDAGGFDMVELISRQGLETPKDLPRTINWLIAVYEAAVNNVHSMDFDDQVFMPIFHDCTLPNYDNLIVDESQDLNPIQIELCIRSAKRVIAVGDKNQAIYGFRGADPEAINNMQRRLNAKALPLSICYRCPKKVIEEARKIVPEIEASPQADDGIVGSISGADFERRVQANDYVLCRTTAPLVTQCLKFIREDRLATVVGRDIGKQLDSLILKISGGDANMELKAFLVALDAYGRREQGRLAALNREMEQQALEDRVNTIEALALAVSVDPATVVHIRHKIEQIFTDRGEGIVFSTIHKAKGIEAPVVFILKPELLPHPAAKVDWQIQQERNLKYVAITRAQRELYYVK